MKTHYLAVVAFAAMAGAVTTQAHAVDPGGTIDVACTSHALPMTAISNAVADSNYWAPQSARRQMLSLARLACSQGAATVTFLPPVDQRSCQSIPTWSTLCIDQSARTRRAEGSSIETSALE